jgi:predicted HTH transcriptional regulator
MLKLETIEGLNSLHTNQIQESSTLEYKASPAVGNKQEIAKDISAMANAEGGQFVYGMRESNHLPVGLDDGHNSTLYNGLWFEQIIQQNISPRVEGLKIKQVQASDGNVYTIIDVPASKTVHQSGDGRYYRRRNFRNDIMKDYEVREAMNRSTTPDLVLGLDFGAH